MKRVLILTGSPRGWGSSRLMAAAFARGCMSAGHLAETFHAAEHHVGPCRTCGDCWRQGPPCRFGDDDFNSRFAPMAERSDVLALAVPLQWFSFPAQVKAPLDRLSAYRGGPRPLPIREAALLMTSREAALLMTSRETAETAFAGALTTYRQIADSMGWWDRGVITVPGLSRTHGLDSTDALLRAEALGMGI